MVLRPSLLLVLATSLAAATKPALSKAQARRSPSAPPPIAAAPQRVNALRGGSGTVSLQGASRMVKTCAFFASLDALLLGYDIGVVSGILVFVKDRFNLSLLETGNFAAALNAAAIVGAPVSYTHLTLPTIYSV